jgi:diacylglycerol kinase (ATP)
LDGFVTFLNTQHNAVIHFILTLAAFVASLMFHINKMEAIAVIFAVALVWAAEMFNTAIEKLADLVTGEFHPAIKFIKDVSAAAVLVSAIAAFLTGLIIFLPKI